jgi:hypothetical protein
MAAAFYPVDARALTVPCHLFDFIFVLFTPTNELVT